MTWDSLLCSAARFWVAAAPEGGWGADDLDPQAIGASVVNLKGGGGREVLKSKGGGPSLEQLHGRDWTCLLGRES